ncbi:MAG TPA: alkaline phosphatase family protein [Bacteroidia bacterium]|nr:alkaline phosphatase family protein [Bacteroidia bacterium]
MAKKLFLLFILPLRLFSQPIPQPNKVVVVILENHSYQYIIDSTYAPYIDSIAGAGALFSDYHGLGYPSQPNYIKLFSGSDQGIIDDDFPLGLLPFSTPNLASSLIDSGFTFKGYAEDLPDPGAIISWSTGNYYFKHTPWPCWQGPFPAQHQLPEEDSLNLPFTYFPSDYDSLPDLCFVIPNADNNMHDGPDPLRITIGDDWIRSNLSGYINWCQANNSLFILTFDEDDGNSQNRVPLIIYGPSLVVQGVYPNYHDHYGLLCTLEDMFSLPYIGNDSLASCIHECWQPVGVPETDNQILNVSIIPNPVSSSTNVTISYSGKQGKAKIILEDQFGKKVKELQLEIKNSKGQLNLKNKNFAKGIYFLTVYIDDQFYKTEKIIFE